MRKGLRHDMPLRLFLQAIITDGRGCVQRLFNITLLQYVAAAIGMVTPETGKAIGLQFKLYRQFIGARLAKSLLCLPDLGTGAKQVLHVMTDFMCAAADR